MTMDRRKVGYMFQQPTLLAWRTTLNNVLLPIEIRYGKKAAERERDHAMQLLEMAGIGEFHHAYAHQLSGGMAQRAAICRMLITNPTLLLLDEPFGALDELTRDAMDEELGRVVEESGATSFIVTHSIPEAVFLADAVYVMTPRPGRIAKVIPIPFPRPRSISVTTIRGVCGVAGCRPERAQRGGITRGRTMSPEDSATLIDGSAEAPVTAPAPEPVSGHVSADRGRDGGCIEPSGDARAPR